MEETEYLMKTVEDSNYWLKNVVDGLGDAQAELWNLRKILNEATCLNDGVE